MKAAALFLLTLCACGSAEELEFYAQEVELAEEPSAEPEPLPAAPAQPAPIRRNVMRINPQLELVHETILALEPLVALGLRFEITNEGGIPVALNDLPGLCGQALSDDWCTHGECEAAGARIWIDPRCAHWNIIAHEILHLSTRWGNCQGSGADAHGHAGTHGVEVMASVAGGEFGEPTRQMIRACGLLDESEGL
jgi:hypothetical protein